MERRSDRQNVVGASTRNCWLSRAIKRLVFDVIFIAVENETAKSSFRGPPRASTTESERFTSRYTDSVFSHHVLSALSYGSHRLAAAFPAKGVRRYFVGSVLSTFVYLQPLIYHPQLSPRTESLVKCTYLTRWSIIQSVIKRSCTDFFKL